MVQHRQLLLLFLLLHFASLFDKSQCQANAGSSSIFIRLFDPNSITTNNDTMQGRLDIYFNDSWGTVCTDTFSDAAARVVCASLGFGRAGRVIRNSYGTGYRISLFDYVYCGGSELSITDCSHSTRGYCNYGDVAISCSNSSTFIRLFDPYITTTNNDTMEGRLEIYFNGVWGTVCPLSFSDVTAGAICSILGFGRTGRFIRNSYGPGNKTILFDYFSCNGNELSITDCRQYRTDYYNDYFCYNQEVAVSCRNYSIVLRLFDPNSIKTNNDTMQGRVEIYYNGAWGTVCADSFSAIGARVVCASLGLGRSGIVVRNSYGTSNGNILFDYVNCNGGELSITDCSHSRWGSDDHCSNGDVVINCNSSSIFIRLFDPNSTTTNNDTIQGRLEIYYNGAWGTVCANSFYDAAARVVCSSLGFGRIGRVIRNSYGLSTGNIVFFSVYCGGSELSITDCSNLIWGSQNYCGYGDVAISCSNSSTFIRLFDPNSTTTNNDTMEGRLEIYFNGVWGTVCPPAFSDVTARVVCSSLGFGRIGRFIRNSYGPGKRNILFDYVSCSGNELSLADCQQIRLGYDYSCYGEEVAVSCRNSSIIMRLFDPNQTTTNDDTMQGRLEIYFNGAWGTVCADSFSGAAARVVCASLGFGRIGRVIGNTYGTSNENIVFDYVSCNGNELSIGDCSHSTWGSDNYCSSGDVVIDCSSSSTLIRLFDPNSTTTNSNTIQGRLEVYFNGAWGTVCTDYFYDTAARVVCASLGFGRTGRVILNSYGPRTGNYVFVSLYCGGNELSINDCSHSIWGSQSYCNSGDTAISCSNSSTFIRLFDPNSTTTNNDTMEGRLEIYFNGVWGTVCPISFTDATARVICFSLGFGRIGRFIRNSQMYGPGNKTILFDYFNCNGNELSITDCRQYRTDYYNDYSCYNQEVAVSCNNSSISLRLFDPDSTPTNETMQGRLEIYYKGVWGTVCAGGFSDASARVVCASLGFGRIGRFIGKSYGTSNGNILFDYVYCSGDELNISACSYSRWGSDNYCNYGDVAINCSNSPIFLRLFDPNSTTINNDTMEGRLEIYFNGSWGTVCADSSSAGTAYVVCASLGFGRAGRIIRNFFGPRNGNTLLDYVYCGGYELSITDCSHSVWGSENFCSYGDVAISCSNSSTFLRLFDPNSTTTNNNTKQGRLEIYYNGVWGTVCNSAFSDAAARVVCSSLGFGRIGRFISNSYGPGNRTILFDYVYCSGNELSFADCQQHRLGYDYDCHEDVAVSCSNSTIFIRLFDPASRTTNNDTMEGRLEIYFNGVWGTLCPNYFSDAAAQIVCSSLGFGRIGRFIPNSYGPGNRNILFDYVYCYGYELSITDCRQYKLGSNAYCYNDEVAVSCRNGSDTTTFSRRETTPLYTTSKPTTPLVTTSKRDISSVMTSKSVVTTAGTLKYTTPFVTQPGPTTLSVTTGKSTTLDATTSKPVTALIENSRATTRLISTLGPTTQKATTVISPTFLIETSMTTTGILSTLGPNRLLDTTTASKVATYDISFVSTALSSAPININECDSSPCLHMATCVDLVNDYKCFCASGFTGRNCETVFNPCDTLPCINGTCNNNTATCACIAGYRGPLCEEEIAECDSDPCQHDSKCVDGLNSYQCQCLEGYTGRNCETEMNECENSPCPNNFTCESSVNRYQCICPNPDEFIGIRCNIPVSPSEKSDSPEFIRTSPNHGPMSGGTKITITGRNLDKYGGIFFLFIGNMKLPIKNWTRSWSEFLVVTTAGESSIVGQDQNLTFEITGGKNISSTLTFTYYPDPEIEDVKPIEQLASGGTTLTVIGNNLNSSASPYLQVILNTTTPGRLNKNITVFNGPTCDASSSTEIYCLMPRVNVVGTTIVNQPGSGLRKRRDASTPNITTYLTLILRSDGAEDSSNKSVVLIAYRGVLDPVSGPMSFNPNDDPFIHIKGVMLSDGIVKDDYEISVGIGDCTNKNLTANELSCRPPIEEPDPGSYQALYCSETGGLPVIVYPGKKVDNDDRKQLHWACLIYPDSKFSWWIVGVICGGSALLLALTVVCFVVCRRRSKQQRGASKHRVHSMSRKSGKNIDHTKADWSKIQVNAQGEPSEEPRNMRNDIYTSRITDDIGLNDYYNDSSMRKFGPNDYDRTLITDLSKGSIYLDERGRQMTQYELDMIAAERNARDLRNPISARYSRGRLSGYYSRGAAPHDSSNYINHKSDSEISAIQDWRNQGRRLRPTTQKQFGGDWNASDNAISVAPAYFLGQNRGLRSPMYGSLDLPTTGDYTGHKVGYRGQ